MRQIIEEVMRSSSGNDMFSAQGYNSGSPVTGHNKYGASATNYLCVSKKDNCV